MQSTLIKIITGLCCIAGLTQPAFAGYGYESTTTPASSSMTTTTSTTSGGYSSSSNQQSQYSSQASQRPQYSSSAATNKRNQLPFWIPLHQGEAMPTNAVIGGTAYHANNPTYVCRANYRGGVHPGKYFAGTCNIVWQGHEVMVPHFEALISSKPLTWTSGRYGSMPTRAIEGGRENHRKLYICQAEYENGTLPGKLVGKKCYFSWNGVEMMTPYYKVLTN